MVLEDYTLGEIQRLIRDEFGLEADPDVDLRITDKVNEALSWIARKRPSWPWLRKDFVLETPVALTGTGDFTNASNIVLNATAAASDRDILIGSDSSSGVSGYVITGVSGSTNTLQISYRGATEIGKSYTLQQGYLELPEDFRQMEISNNLTSLDGLRITYMRPMEFSHFKDTQNLSVGTQHIYTILRDPLDDDENKRWYFAIFPYLNTFSTIKGFYYRAPPKLVLASDTPILPHEQRTVLLYFVRWFMCLPQGHELLANYRNMALDQLEIMGEDDDKDASFNPGVGPGRQTLDMSKVRAFTIPGGEPDFNPPII